MHIIAHSFMKQIQLTMDFGHVHRLVHLIIDQRINTFVHERSCPYKNVHTYLSIKSHNLRSDIIS